MFKLMYSFYQVRELMESPVCVKHACSSGDAQSQAMDMNNCPYVMLQLRSFATRVHTLLQSHDGGVPLTRLVKTFLANLFVWLT